MNRKNKINFAKDFFAGKDPKIDPLSKPRKFIEWHADKPDIYTDRVEEGKTYTPAEVASIGKKNCVVMLKIIRTSDDIPISENASRILNEAKKQFYGKQSSVDSQQ